MGVVAVGDRRDPELAGIRLIAISGYCTPADSEDALAAGFECLLGKPADLGKIRSALDAPAASGIES